MINIFLDEAGILDFSRKGTEYFVLTSLTLERPFAGYKELVGLRYDLVEYGYDLEEFHASEDRQAVRDQVFEVIQNNLNEFRLDTLIVEKRKTAPPLQQIVAFYPRMVGYLLGYIFNGLDLSKYTEVVVFTDTIPHKKKRKAIEGETKKILKNRIPEGSKFRVMHHSSRSNICLQIADYCCWAVYRKWERNDTRSYNLIAEGLHSEFEIFRDGEKYYY